MKRYSLFACLCMFFPMLSFAATEITLVEDPWPPYITVDESKEKVTGGIAVEIIRKVFERIPDTTVKFEIRPWKRALKETEDGLFDGLIALSKTPEREKFLVYPDPIFEGRLVFFYSPAHKPNGIQWESFKDLEKYTIGAISGYAGLKRLQEKAAEEQVNLNISEVTTEQQVFKMLLSGRVDGVLSNEAVGYSVINENGWRGQIIPTKKAIFDAEQYYMAFSKKSPAQKLIPQINEVIGQLKAEGVINKILLGE